MNEYFGWVLSHWNEKWIGNDRQQPSTYAMKDGKHSTLSSPVSLLSVLEKAFTKILQQLKKLVEDIATEERAGFHTVMDAV